MCWYLLRVDGHLQVWDILRQKVLQLQCPGLESIALLAAGSARAKCWHPTEVLEIDSKNHLQRS